MLNIPQALVFKTGLNRKNLFYEVRLKPKSHDDVINDIVKMIKKNFVSKSGNFPSVTSNKGEEMNKNLGKA